MNLFLCVGVLDNFVQLGLVESRITMRMIGIVDCDNELDNGYAECSIAFCHRVCLMAHLVSCVGNMLQGMFESNFSQTLSPLSLMYHDVCRALSPVWYDINGTWGTHFQKNSFVSFRASQNHEFTLCPKLRRGKIYFFLKFRGGEFTLSVNLTRCAA